MGNDTEYDVIIVGGGAAALAASIYAVRAMLKTLIIEKQAVGGQILYTGEIENYPGFPEPIGGRISRSSTRSRRSASASSSSTTRSRAWT